MVTNKKITDLKDYTTVLPYASEIFGVYQPLLGWKSKRIEARFNQGHVNDKQKLVQSLTQKFKAVYEIDIPENNTDPCSLDLRIGIGELMQGQKRKSDSLVLNTIAEKLPQLSNYKTSVWPELLNNDKLNEFLHEFVMPYYKAAYNDLCRNADELLNMARRQHTDSLPELKSSLEKQLGYESAIAGLLSYLNKNKDFDALKDLFYTTPNNGVDLNDITGIINAENPQDAYLNINNINPRELDQLKSVGLSPISIVHLFRQYFYEFETFLGSPVTHIWLSPGSMVELIETSTRKTIIERTVESSLETSIKAETSSTEKDELSEAVKEDNKADTKFGATVSGHQGWIGGEVNATASLDMAKTQQIAREQTHKQMREQTKKLATEIRQNFKSTFKTVTEFTDTSSKRYVLNNTSSELVNYELRRKMRQVGVQLQDIGTYLCWQSYVDDPGAELGLAELVNISKTPDVGEVPHPATPVLPEAFEQVEEVMIPFVGIGDNDDKGEHYTNGVETDDGDLHIQCDFTMSYFCQKPNFTIDPFISLQGLDDVQPVIRTNPGDNVEINGRSVKFILHLNTVHFHDQPAVKVRIKLRWIPDPAAMAELDKKAHDDYQANMDKYEAEKALKFKQAFIDAAKERIKLASKITARKYEDLREEERIVVYRKLVQDMLFKGIMMPDDATRHVVSELINAIFDVDKMLYFVAPEWWRPRLHQGHQNLGKYKAPTAATLQKQTGLSPNLSTKVASIGAFASALLDKTSVLINKDGVRQTPLKEFAVGWGGIGGQRDDNYYITEDSDPAKLGSSLGWLLQLDGDNLRNAFLNAPWVKAVIPVRPGKEEAAINWLKQVEGFNGINDTDTYHTEDNEEKDSNGQPLNGQKMIDVLLDLAKKVKKKHEEELTTGVYPKQDPDGPPVDPGSTVTSTPVDRVFEHGFYPLQGGFRNKPGEENFSVFSQWVEILPTDQLVPVEVKYDPKTGMQK